MLFSSSWLMGGIRMWRYPPVRDTIGALCRGYPAGSVSLNAKH
jgi:hypothetical protein